MSGIIKVAKLFGRAALSVVGADIFDLFDGLGDSAGDTADLVQDGTAGGAPDLSQHFDALTSNGADSTTDAMIRDHFAHSRSYYGALKND